MRENKEIYKSSGSITFVIRIILCVWICYLYLDAMTIQKSQRKKEANFDFPLTCGCENRSIIQMNASHCIVVMHLHALFTDSDIILHAYNIQPHFWSISILYLFLFAEIFFFWTFFDALHLFSRSLFLSRFLYENHWQQQTNSRRIF